MNENEKKSRWVDGTHITKLHATYVKNKTNN